MLPVEHNGEAFHYLVSYRRRGRRASEVVRRVADWRQSQLIVSDVQTYSEYEVTVQAANRVGPAPQSTVERIIGHSAENGLHTDIYRHGLRLPIGWVGRSTDVSTTRRFDDRRFDDKFVDRQTFRRHGSDVSTTHFGRFADK